MRILLVEDDLRLAAFIAEGLADAGFTVDHVQRADDAEAALAAAGFDAAVLDLGLPDADGMDLLRSLRGRGAGLPVLVLTARDGLADRVKGLNAGADDYLLKPFAMDELVARLRALLRRPGSALGLTLRSGGLALDTAGREVTVGGRHLALSRRETDILEQLLRRTGRVVPKSVIEERVYGFEDALASNSVEVHVHRLRRKLEKAEAGVEIHTLRGLGYLLGEAKG